MKNKNMNHNVNGVTMIDKLLEVLNAVEFNHLMVMEQPLMLAVLGFFYGRASALNDVASGKLLEVFAKGEEGLHNPRNVQFALAICDALKKAEWNADPEYLAAFYYGSEDAEEALAKFEQEQH